MKKKVKIIAVVMAALLAVSFAGVSYFIGIQIFSASTQLVTNEGTAGVPDTLMKKSGIDYPAFCDRYRVEQIAIPSSLDGHSIPADYLYSAQAEHSKNNKTVILVHGLGGNRYSNYPVAEMFLEQGYHVLTYDQRSSNENTARYTTFGYLEKYDLIDYVAYVRERAPEQTVGIWGTSFGGATAGLAVGYEDTASKVDFLILDCPVSSMKWMVEEEMRAMDTGLPIPYLVWCGNLVTKLKLGFSYEDAEVSRAVSALEIPVLIINSKADQVTPYFMGKDIYDGIPGENKTIWTDPDSAHAELWFDANAEYRARVWELIEHMQ